MNNAKTQTTHLIADESLGGLLREYTETDRKAFEKGDFAIYKGKMHEVTYVNCDILSLDGRIHLHENYATKLLPTDIIHVDGERFRMVDRKAEIGEKVVIVNNEMRHGYFIGDIRDMEEDGAAVGMYIEAHDVRDYHVLEPVESALDIATESLDSSFAEVTETDASPSVIEMLANLSQRIVALEKQRDDYGERIVDLEQDNGRMLDENARIKDELDTLHRNNVRLGEDIERLKAANKTHEVDAVDFNGFINSVADAVADKIAKGITKGGSRNA